MVPSAPRRRASDASPILRFVDGAQRWAILWFPALWLAKEIGFGVLTPRSGDDANKAAVEARLAIAQAQLDTMRHVAEGLRSVHQQMAADLAALVRFRCLDSQQKARLAGLTCPMPERAP